MPVSDEVVYGCNLDELSKRRTHMREFALVPETGIPGNTLFDDVYDRLKAMASQQRAGAGRPRALCSTELAHESYRRTGRSGEKHFRDPLGFFAYAPCAIS